MRWLFLFVFTCVSSAAFAQSENNSRIYNEKASQLYNKGIQLLEAGKGEQGRKDLLEVIKQYPGTDFAKLAKDSIDKPLISAVEFKDVKPLSEREIRKRLEAANSDMMPGKIYKPESIEQTRQLLAGMLVKRKIKAKDVTVTARDIPDHKVILTIAVVH